MRDVLHVADLYDLIRWQIADLDAALRRAVHNVGGGRTHSVSLAELTALCRERAGRTDSDRVAIRDTSAADVPYYITDNTASPRRPAGRRARSVETLLDDVFAWLREHRATLEPVLSAAAPVATAPAASLNHGCCPHHRRGRPHRLRGRALLRRQGLRHRRRRQRHAALLLRRRGQHVVAAGPARAAICADTGTSPPTSATRRRWTSSSRRYGRDIALVIHAAAQPSHDWAAREPLTDFTVNANGTLVCSR